MKKLLITAFDPFGGETINPALEVLKQLPNNIGDVEIVKQEIPTVFNKSISVLVAAMESHKPDAVICIGQAGGRANIALERIAINCSDTQSKDNEGNQPVDCKVVEDGPDAYFTTLPIKKMVQNMRDAGIPAEVSNTAGTFVCNHLLYGALHHAAQHSPGTKVGFVHIPYLPQQTANRPSMAAAVVLAGLESMVMAL